MCEFSEKTVNLFCDKIEKVKNEGLKGHIINWVIIIVLLSIDVFIVIKTKEYILDHQDYLIAFGFIIFLLILFLLYNRLVIRYNLTNNHLKIIEKLATSQKYKHFKNGKCEKQ